MAVLGAIETDLSRRLTVEKGYGSDNIVLGVERTGFTSQSLYTLLTPAERDALVKLLQGQKQERTAVEKAGVKTGDIVIFDSPAYKTSTPPIGRVVEDQKGSTGDVRVIEVGDRAGQTNGYPWKYVKKLEGVTAA